MKEKTKGITYIIASIALITLGLAYSITRGLQHPPIDVQISLLLGPMFAFLILFIGIDKYKTPKNI